jgi:hypothetical protein
MHCPSAFAPGEAEAPECVDLASLAYGVRS